MLLLRGGRPEVCHEDARCQDGRLGRGHHLEGSAYESVLRHLPEDLRPVVTVAYYTGWRLSDEILSRQWRHVDFKAQELRLEPGTTKNTEGRTFPFGNLAGLREVLEAQHVEHERLKAKGRVVPWVFHRQGKPILSMTKAFRAACRLAGCPGRIPHDFRRTAVRNLERAGVPRSVAMKLTGHKTESVYRRYAIASEDDMRVAGQRLGDYHAAKKDI